MPLCLNIKRKWGGYDQLRIHVTIVWNGSADNDSHLQCVSVLSLIGPLYDEAVGCRGRTRRYSLSKTYSSCFDVKIPRLSCACLWSEFIPPIPPGAYAHTLTHTHTVQSWDAASVADKIGLGCTARRQELLWRWQEAKKKKKREKTGLDVATRRLHGCLCPSFVLQSRYFRTSTLLKVAGLPSSKCCLSGTGLSCHWGRRLNERMHPWKYAFWGRWRHRATQSTVPIH